MRIQIRNGDRYGRWTILKEVETRNERRFFQCKCDCGKAKIVVLFSLTSGISKSCGCLSLQMTKKRSTTHGKTSHPLYNVFSLMKYRCNDKKSKNYKNYGGRGIKCEWGSFEDFYRDMNVGYKKNLQIDRIDNNGNYSKENCRWVTSKENNQNRRDNNVFRGECASEAVKRLKGSPNLINTRLRIGWSLEKAFTTPITKRLKV